MNNRILLAAALVLSLLCMGFAYQAQNRPKWEYHTERYGNISERKLNELGEQGWEFVGAANEDGLNEFIFKRPK